MAHIHEEALMRMAETIRIPWEPFRARCRPAREAV